MAITGSTRMQATSIELLAMLTVHLGRLRGSLTASRAFDVSSTRKACGVFRSATVPRQAARRAIRQAGIVFGSPRQLALLPACFSRVQQRHAWPSRNCRYRRSGKSRGSPSGPRPVSQFEIMPSYSAVWLNAFAASA